MGENGSDMAMALTHFAFGAGCATLLLAYLPVRTRYTHPIAVLSGVWAMFPDFWQVTPIFRDGFHQLHDSVFSNVFWFHQLFDLADVGDSRRLAAVTAGVYLLVAIIYAERQRDAPVFDIDWPHNR